MEEIMREISPAPKKKSGKKKWLILLVVLAVAAVLVLRGCGGRRNMEQDVTYQESAAEIRDVTRSLSGSGTLQPADAYTVNTLVSGEVLADTFEEGDIVGKDALLYTIDSSDASSSQSQAQRTYNQAVKSKYPTAELSGTVSEVYVSNGDSVSNGTKLLKIVGDNNIYMDFLFAYTAGSEFRVGQQADIFITGYDGSISGTVTAISDGTTASSTGAMLTTVRVKAVNPGLVTGTSTATAAIGSYTSYGSSPVKVSSSSVITAGASGTLTGFNWLPGDSISSGQRVGTITGDSIDNQIENALNSLENAQDKLADYQVVAPISGTVIAKEAKVGDNIEGGANSTLCIIYDMSYLEMTMNIDELDISDVAVGQTVSITADAVEGRIYMGEVTRVSIVGSTAGGITTYPVTVRINDYDGLLPGMNVDAEIVLSAAEGVLTIPNNAVNRGDTVLVTADSPSAANALEMEAPEGYVYVRVTTGLSDDSYIEITSGLQAGDTVAYLRTSSGNMMMGMMMGGMPGGMPGGMGGGMPSGGRTGMPGGGPRG